ncbi:MAG: hypothetical protein ACT4P1_05155 [Sporichthyaceae bacterium]
MRNRSFGTTIAAIASAGALLLGATACGDDEENVEPAAANADPVATLTDLKGEMTEVELDAGFLDGLTSLKLAPGTVGTAKLKGTTLSFPITGGNATYYTPGSRTPYVESSIEHDGSGISLTGGEGKDKVVVELTDFVVDAGTSMLMGDVAANGKSVVKDAPLFFLDGRTLEPLKVNEAGDTGVLFGTTVSLTKAAADLLNKTYSTDALAEFFKVGVARITLKLA